jgi:hypothetical protein
VAAVAELREAGAALVGAVLVFRRRRSGGADVRPRSSGNARTSRPDRGEGPAAAVRHDAGHDAGKDTGKDAGKDGDGDTEEGADVAVPGPPPGRSSDGPR